MPHCLRSWVGLRKIPDPNHVPSKNLHVKLLFQYWRK